VARLTDPGASLETLHWGRNYLYVSRIETETGPVDVVVKQFRGHSVKDRWRGSKAERSWRVAHALLDAGLLTPEPVLLIEPTDGDRPSFYVCRHLAGLLEARYLLRAANAGREREEFPEIDLPAVLTGMGKMARRLHDAGFWHRDLTSGNVLIETREEGYRFYLLDLNRTRAGRVPSFSERMRDLSRMPVLRPEHQELYLKGYWDGPVRGRTLYLFYHRGFLLKNRSKQRLRAGAARVKSLLVPRGVHPHIPEAPTGASVRDRTVWDHLSDQPHQHAGRLDKLRVRLGDARSHAEEAAVVAAALPRILARYRALKRDLHQKPVPFAGAGVCLRPWPEAPEALLGLVDELGARHVLLRLHPWEEDHSAEEALARALHERGLELTFALPQNRDLVRDPAAWRRSIERLAPLFLPYGRRFQVGQAINRSKWGVWTLDEYVELVRSASEVLRREPGVEILGPSVIDFEHHVTAAVLNLRRPGLRFDAVSSLLYVDRRGAPESRQAGFDTVDKVLLLKAIAETGRNSSGRCWITEVNWPLREGPHSPAGRAVSVSEEEQADYLARYCLLALGTGAVERVFWWQMVARGYGLVDPAAGGALRRRPSFAALRTLIRELEGSRLESVRAAGAARLYRFRRMDAGAAGNAGDGGDVAVAWSAGPGPVRIALPRPAAAAVGRDGGALAVPSGTEVEATSSPVYYRLTPA
jgi:hypothetical protein